MKLNFNTAKVWSVCYKIIINGQHLALFHAVFKELESYDRNLKNKRQKWTLCEVMQSFYLAQDIGIFVFKQILKNAKSNPDW